MEVIDAGHLLVAAIILCERIKHWIGCFISLYTFYMLNWCANNIVNSNDYCFLIANYKSSILLARELNNDSQICRRVPAVRTAVPAQLQIGDPNDASVNQEGYLLFRRQVLKRIQTVLEVLCSVNSTPPVFFNLR